MEENNKEKQDEVIKFKMRKGRKRVNRFCYDVFRNGSAAGVYNKLKEKVSLEEISELIYLFLEETRETIITERLGVELPCGIGYIQVSGVKEKAYKVGAAPKKVRKAVVNPNYHTEGYVFKSWYRFTNNDSIIKRKVGLFEHAHMYRFAASKSVKRMIKEHIQEGKWTNWGRFENRAAMFGQSNLSKKKDIVKPTYAKLQD
jgi:hypothetical protein